MAFPGMKSGSQSDERIYEDKHRVFRYGALQRLPVVRDGLFPPAKKGVLPGWVIYQGGHPPIPQHTHGFGLHAVQLRRRRREVCRDLQSAGVEICSPGGSDPGLDREEVVPLSRDRGNGRNEIGGGFSGCMVTREGSPSSI